MRRIDELEPQECIYCKELTENPNRICEVCMHVAQRTQEDKNIEYG